MVFGTDLTINCPNAEVFLRTCRPSVLLFIQRFYIFVISPRIKNDATSPEAFKPSVGVRCVAFDSAVRGEILQQTEGFFMPLCHLSYICHKSNY